MSDAYIPGPGHEDPAGQQPGGEPGWQVPPGDVQPGFATPGARKTRSSIGGLPRVWGVLIGIVVMVAGIIGIISGIRTLSGSGSTSSFNDPAQVAAVIKSQVNQKLTDRSGPDYQPGLTVTSVTCTKSGNNTDSCLIRLSDGSTLPAIATISDGGSRVAYHEG
jgi:hypothetical protein